MPTKDKLDLSIGIMQQILWELREIKTILKENSGAVHRQGS